MPDGANKGWNGCGGGVIATAREPRGRRGALGGTVALGGTKATREPVGGDGQAGTTATPTDTVRTSPAIDAVDSPNHGSADDKKAIDVPIAGRSADDNSCRCWCCAAHTEAIAVVDGRPIGPKVLPSAAKAVDSLTGPRDLPNVTEAVDRQLGSMDLPSAIKATEATIVDSDDPGAEAYRSFCLGRDRAIQRHSCPEASRSSYPTGSHYPARAVSTMAEPVTTKATVANSQRSIHRMSCCLARGQHDSEQAFAVHRIPH